MNGADIVVKSYGMGVLSVRVVEKGPFGGPDDADELNRVANVRTAVKALSLSPVEVVQDGGDGTCFVMADFGHMPCAMEASMAEEEEFVRLTECVGASGSNMFRARLAALNESFTEVRARGK
jgi:hypothetical protein